MKSVKYLTLVGLILVAGLSYNCGGGGQHAAPTFNRNDGGQIVFSAIDDQNRTLVMMTPQMFGNDYNDEIYLERHEIGIDINDEEYDADIPVYDYYSEKTGYIQFYINGVEPGDEVKITLLTVTIPYMIYYGTLSADNPTFGTTTYFETILGPAPRPSDDEDNEDTDTSIDLFDPCSEGGC